MGGEKVGADGLAILEQVLVRLIRWSCSSLCMGGGKRTHGGT